ncbi:MAG: sulfite exporter TauE/SafE family protein [Thiothrix sp.]|nr:MAG: sulfite exporter TauE/SafE family protein [Thiothrix sp.]
MIESSWLSAFLVGFLGGVHCFGMCGGIVTALSLGVREDIREHQQKLLWLQLAYNLGRIISYTTAGLIAGTLGFFAHDLSGMQEVRIGLQLIAAVIMIALGLYLGGWWFGLLKVEQMGSGLWRYVEPLGRKLIPVQTMGGALGLGLVWGWLPCGLIYSVLIWALAVADPAEGALLMLSFGLGTLPNLLLMGVFAAQVGRYLQKAWLRKMAGMLVVVFGAWQIYDAIMPLIPGRLLGE